MWLRRRRNGFSAGLHGDNHHIDGYQPDRNADANPYPHANSHPDTHPASADAGGSDDDFDG
jgi:hypothetical protein